MISRLLIAWALMGLCVTVHALGITTALRWLKARLPQMEGSFWKANTVLVCLAAWTIQLHVLQILIWAIYYRLSGALPEFTLAVYFSAVTYTTTGYGDVVLPQGWRFDGGIEALTGILMCGLSTGMFFAVFSQLFSSSKKA